MRHKPVDSSAAMADGVDTLLRRFRSMDRAVAASPAVSSTDTGFQGPIETSVLVASAGAPPEIRAVADFVCDGVSDEVEINAAVSYAIHTLSLSYARIQLTGGQFYCAGNIQMDVLRLEGVGINQTLISFGNGTYTGNAAIYAPYGVSDLYAGMSISSGSTPSSVVYTGRYGTIENVDINAGAGEVSAAAVELNTGRIVSCAISMTATSLPAIKTSVLTIDAEPGLIALCHIDCSSASGVDGISVLGNNYNIVGNSIYKAGNDGISIAAGSGGVLVTGNRIIDTGRHGVYIASTDGYNIVASNVIQDATTDGINITSASSYDVIGPNQIVGFGVSDVDDSGTGTVLVPSTGTSPLTTKGDVWGFDTADNRLPVGTDTHVLTADSAETLGVKWAAAAASSPLTTKGDLIAFDTDDNRLPVGTDDYVLTADAAETLGVKWAAAAGGVDTTAIHKATAAEISAITAKATPINADFLLIEDSAASDAKKRITIGDLPSSGTSPLTTKGDLFGHDTSDARIPIGTDDYVLTADATAALGLKWAAPSATADGSKATSMMLGGM